MIREELDFNPAEMKELARERCEQFTQEQRHVFNTIVEAVKSNTPKLVFIDGRGGCGKSWVQMRCSQKSEAWSLVVVWPLSWLQLA